MPRKVVFYVKSFRPLSEKRAASELTRFFSAVTGNKLVRARKIEKPTLRQRLMSRTAYMFVPSLIPSSLV